MSKKEWFQMRLEAAEGRYLARQTALMRRMPGHGIGDTFRREAYNRLAARITNQLRTDEKRIVHQYGLAL